MSVDFRARFKAIEDGLRAELEKVRATFAHAGNKGTVVEKEFRRFIVDHTAHNLDVGEGEVIDSFGNFAGAIGGPGQIDVIIIDGSHPRTFARDQPGIFFIEGVVGAGEIKSVLTSTDLGTAIAKSRSFKELTPVIGKCDMTVTCPSDLARFVNKRPYFLFAFESQLTLDTIAREIINYCTVTLLIN
jgi:hypothetical protein